MGAAERTGRPVGRYTRHMHRAWALLPLLLTLASTPLAGAAAPVWSRETNG